MNIILDIGGTKTRIGLVSDTFKLLETSFFSTKAKYNDGIKQILEFIKNKDIRVNKICAGLPGVFNKKSDSLYFAPNLRGWIGKNIKEDLTEAFKADVYLENDAALAGLGEAVFGGGKENNIIVYLTISTGIGGVRIVNKKIDEKVYGFEPGHHILDSDTVSKTFESLASGKSIKRIYGKTPEDITDKKIWEKIVKPLAVGISNSIYFWSPELVVLGGGVTQSVFFDVDFVAREVKRIIEKTYPETPVFKKAVLGDFAGIWGGIAYLKVI